MPGQTLEIDNRIVEVYSIIPYRCIIREPVRPRRGETSSILIISCMSTDIRTDPVKQTLMIFAYIEHLIVPRQKAHVVI